MKMSLGLQMGLQKVQRSKARRTLVAQIAAVLLLAHYAERVNMKSDKKTAESRTHKRQSKQKQIDPRKALGNSELTKVLPSRS